MALSGVALAVFDTAGSGDWKSASATVRDMEAAWDTLRGGNVPRLIEPRMDEALRVLEPSGPVRPLLVDEAAGVPGGVGADAFALDYIRDRIRAALDARDLTRINTELGTIQVAVVDDDLALAAAAAERLRRTLAELQPTA